MLTLITGQKLKSDNNTFVAILTSKAIEKTRSVFSDKRYTV